MTEEIQVYKGKKSSITYFVISFFLLFILSTAILFTIEKELRNLQFQELKENEERVVKLGNEFLGKEANIILADLKYLHDAFKTKLKNQENYDEIASNWILLSTYRRIYDQIRFIDYNGDEKIRINLKDEGAYAVPASQLQNKRDRYYFYEAVKLKDGSFNISPLDLNVENGEIEVPYKPMIRFSTPLYDADGKLDGIIVLNYLADGILKSFRELSSNSHGELVLLNSDGYWLSSTDSNNEWNFMFEERKNRTFAAMYSSEWDLVKKGKDQQLTSNGLFTYAPFDLNRKISSTSASNTDNINLMDGNWYIVSIVLKDNKHKSLFIDDFYNLIADVFIKNTLYFLLVFLISGIVAFLIYVNKKTFSRIKYYSEFDALTKVYNRRAGILKLNNIFSLDDRRHFLMSLCFIDVNGLKQVNDELGHRFGDELIISVVNIIIKSIRQNDFVIRLGGDEFLIVFNGIDVEESEQVWERIKRGYDNINNDEERAYIISVSHGIVGFKNSQKSKVDDLIKAADEKMYKEKRIMKENFSVLKKDLNKGEMK